MKSLKAFTLLFVLGLVTHYSSYGQACTTNGALVSVTYKKFTSYEIVTFKFKQTCAVPAVSVANPPFIEDPSGNTILVAGAQHREIKFSGIEWMCTIPTIFQSSITSTSKVRAIKKTGQFEGIVSYVIGLKSTASFAQVFPTTTSAGFCYIKFIIF